jgi:hypothetical protein
MSGCSSNRRVLRPGRAAGAAGLPALVRLRWALGELRLRDRAASSDYRGPGPTVEGGVALATSCAQGRLVKSRAVEYFEPPSLISRTVTLTPSGKPPASVISKWQRSDISILRRQSGVGRRRDPQPSRAFSCQRAWLRETQQHRRAPARSDRYDLGRSVHSLFVIVRIGRVRRLSLPRCHLGASRERQYDEQRGEPSIKVHWLRWARPGSRHCSARCWA